ncbi:MAG: glycosyltransferase family 2 protein [Chloroflexota bacterium]
MTTLTVIIPAFNEERGIRHIVERVLAVREPLEQIGVALEFIVVDDGSRDQTTAQVAQFPDVRLIKHVVNRGYGAAIKTGFRQATGDYLAFLDADGTYPPESLPEMCRVALQQRADLVIGSRMSGAQSEMPVTRRIGNLAFASLLSLIGNVTVRDTASGMRVLRRDVLPSLYPLPDGLQFTPAMSTRAIHENLKIVEVPIAYAERVGRSKLSVVRDGFRFTNAIVWTALAYNPVRILGLLSLAAMSVAVVIGLTIVALRLSGVTTQTPPMVYALVGAAVLAFTGITLFTLGAMFNYLVALFHKKPVRQGLFGKPIFNPPLDRQFGWMGVASAVGGVLLGSGAFVLSLSGWDIARLWFYLLIGAMLVIIGLQLFISWIVMRVLEELAGREVAVQRDMVESEMPTVTNGLIKSGIEAK